MILRYLMIFLALSPISLIGFTQIPSNGLNLWIKADSNIISNNNYITEWGDNSPLLHHAVQIGDTSLQPIIVDSVTMLNNFPVVRFSGQEYLTFPQSASTEYSFFVVVNTGSLKNNNEGYIGTWDNTVTENSIWYLGVGEGDYNIGYGGAGYGGNNAGLSLGNSNHILTNHYYILSTFKDLTKWILFCNRTFLREVNDNSSQTYSGNVNWVIGCGDNFFHAAKLSGDIAELIIYNRVVSDIEKLQIENYLNQKYAPPANLGPDINITYGFCPQTIHAGQRFTNYLWNTGDTTESITISKSGIYSVTVTDIFGTNSFDTITVSYPDINLFNHDTLLCLGNSLLITSKISSTPGYIFLWANNDTMPSINVNFPMNYWVKVTDTLNCYSYSDTIVLSIDSFPSQLTLPHSISTCAGNHVSVIYNNDLSSLFFQWSDLTTDSILITNSPGTFWVNATNQNNCTATDTVNVSILGIAPTVNFLADTVCFGDSTSFTNLSSLPLDSSIWNFGDNTFSHKFNPKHLYLNSGNIVVSLTAYNNVCSNSISKTIFVKTLPVANFSYSSSCSTAATFFINQSSIALPDSIISYNWNFGNNDTSSLKNPSIILNAGSNSVILTITASNGCIDSNLQTLFTVSNAPLPIFSFCNPSNNSIVSDSILSFSWNCQNAIYYILQLSKQIDFSTIIESDSLTTTTKIFSISNLNNNDTIYWRIIAVNICGNQTISPLKYLIFFNAAIFPNQSLWIKADTNVIKTNKYISQWPDNSNAVHNAVQTGDTTLQPHFIDSVIRLNNYPVVRFTGQQYLKFPQQASPEYTFIALINTGDEKQNEEGYVASWNNIGITNPGWSLGVGQGIFGNGTNAAGFGGNLSISLGPTEYIETNKYYILSTTKDTLQWELHSNGNFIRNIPDNSIQTYSGNVEWTIGAQDGYYYQGKLSGDIAELLIFNRKLSVSEISQIENYLRQKYAPPVNLGPDINNLYNLCTQIIHAGQRFTNFQWTKNGTTNPADTLENITINQSGTYKVTVTDIFGVQSSDSINVTFPTFTQLTNTTICFGDTLQWNLNLTGHYNYHWNDNDTNAIRNITLENTYQVTITDTTAQHCSIVTQPVFVKVDSFPNFVSLGPDTSVCSGNTLYLQNGYIEAVSYLWSNGNTTNNYVVSAQDTINPILVTVTDSLGCIARDTLNITGISGVAPTANFSYQGICFGDTTFFADASNGTGINSWLWNFNNQGSSPDSSTNYIFNSPGIYPVKLIIKTQDGCSNSVIKDIEIHHLPVPDFISKNNCTDNFTKFENHSLIPIDSITTYIWHFGDNTTLTGKDQLHSYTDTGSYNVVLIATSNFGCIDTITKTIKIKKAPQADFLYSPVCKGQPVYFADHTQTSGTNQIHDRKWEFGDASFSLVNNPTHTYNVLDTFIVKLITKSINGCIDTAYKTLIVTLPPEANFSDTSACVNTIHQLLDSSTSTIPVTHWKWTIDSIGQLTTQNPTVTFSSTGQYATKLIVLTQAGCSDTVSHNINVHNNPAASFVIIPEVAAPLQTVTFENLTSGANQYFWNFGDGHTSSYFEPVHTFADSGIYNVSLISIDTFGCSDSMLSSIRIIVPQYDIAVLEVNSTTTGNFIKVSAKIANFGSLPVDSVYLFVDMGNGVMIKEALNYHLLAGEIINYTFTSQLNITPQNTPSYICVDALPSTTITDFAPANNHLCKALAEDFEVLPPYPSPVGNYIYIEFIIPTEGNVTISLYNALGQKMKTLFNQFANAGFNRYVYLAGEITKGAYYYQVEYNGKFKTQNFIKY